MVEGPGTWQPGLGDQHQPAAGRDSPKELVSSPVGMELGFQDRFVRNDIMDGYEQWWLMMMVNGDE